MRETSSGAGTGAISTFTRSLSEYEEGDLSRREGGSLHMLSSETDGDSYKHTKLDYHATVRDLPSNERPRERLQHFGPQALSMAELLAIILRTGTRGDNAMELANKLLAKYGGLPGLVRADFRELCAEHGMGEAKSAQVKAALEIGRRLGTLHVDARYKISTPAEAANLVMLDLAYLDTEQMRILLLDSKSQLVEKISSYRQQLGPARRRGLPAGHHPQLPRPHPLPQPSQRRPDAVTGGHRSDLAASGGRPHPRHRTGRPHHHRPPALRQPQRAPEVGVGRGGDPAYWHLARSGHSWQRGRPALHTSAPKSSTAQLTWRLRFPLTRRRASACSQRLDPCVAGSGDPKNRHRHLAMFTSRSGSPRPYTMASTALAV